MDADHKAKWMRKQTKGEASMAFGDGANDIKIFEAADVAIAIDPQDDSLVNYADGVIDTQNFQFMNQIMDTIICD